jgi:hypothetical protein
MTAKKANPAKRGRKPISNDVRRILLLRWQRFARGKVGANVADEFLKANRAWFDANNIHPGDYTTLRNISVMGRKAREQQKATRLQEWGIIVDILGRRSFSTTAHLIRYAQRRALGIPN